MSRKVFKLAMAMATAAFAVVALPVVAGATPARATAGSATLSATAPGPADFLTWVNSLRASVNTAPLSSNTTLTSVA